MVANGGIWKCFHSGDGMALPDQGRPAHLTTKDRLTWDTLLVSLHVVVQQTNKQIFQKIRYLEEDDEGQSGCQDAPVMFGERVRIRRPGRLSVVFIPKPKNRSDHRASTFGRCDWKVSGSPGVTTRQQPTAVVLGSNPGTEASLQRNHPSEPPEKPVSWWTWSTHLQGS